MTKFLMTADVHANRTRAADVVKLFNNITDKVIKEKINYVLIGGDLWDSPINNTKASGFVDIVSAIKKLQEVCQVVFIYGTISHESSGSLSVFSALGCTVIESAEVLDLDGMKLLCIPEPRRSNFVRDTVQETTDAMNEYLTESCKNKADVILFHGEISGAMLQNGVKAKSDVQLTKQMIDNTGAQLTLAGHIHLPSNVYKNVYYVGSPIPCNFGETHSPSIITFSFDGKVKNFKREETKFPVKKQYDLDRETYEKLYKLKYPNTDIKLKISLTAEEKLLFNIRKEEQCFLKTTEAHSVKMSIYTKKEVSVRSREIAKVTTPEEKLKIYGEVNNVEITETIIDKMKKIEDNLMIKYLFPTHSFELLSIDVKGAKGLKSYEEYKLDFTKYADGILGLVAPNGFGKCILGSSLVLSDKGFEKIGSYDDGTRGFREFKKDFTIDKNHKDTSSHYYSEDVTDTIKITNSLGMSLEGTYEHPILTFNKDCQYEFKKLKDITTDDYVCVPRGMNSFPEKGPHLFYAPHDCDPRYLDKTKPIMFAPEVTPELARFLGYYIANGNRAPYGVMFTSNNKNIVNDFIYCAKECFGIDTFRKDESRYEIHSTLLRQYLEYIFGEPLETARYKKVPDCILQSTKEAQKAFITALFDCDSSICKNNFEYCTASEDISYKVQNMLLNFGVISMHRIKRVKGFDWDYHRIFINSNDLNILMSEVMDKSIKYHYEYNDKTNTNVDVIPYVKQYIKNYFGTGSNSISITEGNKIRTLLYLTVTRNTSYNRLKTHIESLKKYPSEKNDNLRHKLEELYDNNYFYAKITDIQKKHEKTTVYDFTIPKSHRFYSNGYISHNSTLLELCSPYPRMLTRSGTLRSHFYLKDSHRILVFRDENGRLYKLTIQMAAHTDNGLCKYFAETSDDYGMTWNSVPGVDGNLDSYSEWVDGTFGSLPLYLRTAFYTQGKVKGINDIATATKAERITLLSSLLGFDNLSAIHDLIKEELKRINSEMEKYSNPESELSEIETQLNRKKVNEKSYQNDLLEIAEKLATVESNLKYNRRLKSDFDKNFANYSNAVELKEGLENRVFELQTHLDSLKNHKKKNDYYINHQKEIAEYEETLKQFEILKKDSDKRSEKLRNAQEELLLATDAFNKAERQFDIEERKLENTDNRIKSAEDSVCPIGDNCPTCGAKLSERKKANLIKAYSYQVNEVEALKQFKINQTEIVSTAKKALSAAKTELKKATEAKNKYQTAFNEANEKLNATEVWLDMNDLSEYIGYAVVTNLEEDIERTSELLKSAKQQFETLKDVELIDYQSIIDNLEAERTKYEEFRLRLSVDLGSIQTEIKALEEKKEEVENYVNIVRQLSKEHEDYVVLEKAFSNGGIPALELEANAPEIALLTNQILQECYGDKFSVSFSTLKQGRDKLIDDFSIDVTNTETGWTTPIEMLSQGERVWIIQSIYYALSLIRQQKTGFSFNVRFVDESDGALDTEMRLKYVSMLNSVHKYGSARLTVLVTHSQEVKDLLTQIIKL